MLRSSSPRLCQRFVELRSVLAAHRALWQPAPFRTTRPDWCADRPDLAAAVLELDDATLDTLTADPNACRAWLAPRLPIVETLDRLVRLPRLPARVVPPTDAHFDRSVPGRKREQIGAFVAHVPDMRTPVLEWCAGKGHLGRRIAVANDVPVCSLEIDPALCEDATRLATRAGVDQTVVCADVLDAASDAYVNGRTVLALHACGELHRVLVRRAARAGARGYHVAPCCYHVGVAGTYHPLSRDAALTTLDGDAMRVAVTETVTAPRHDRRRLARDQAWKLGFVALRNQLEGEAPRSFRSVPAGWLSGDFGSFCRALARRESVSLPADVDWAHWQLVGERRRAEVRRLELVRHAFRRALEVWLVLDLALGFEQAGFDVRVGTFCGRASTPRNLMVSARR